MFCNRITFKQALLKPEIRICLPQAMIRRRMFHAERSVPQNSSLRFYSLIPLTLVFVSIQSLNAQVNLNGTYTGLEPKRSLTPGDIRTKWYYHNELVIKGDSAHLEQSPVTVRNGRMAWSASDGGYYYWKGLIKRTGKTVAVKLTEDHCDYCPEAVKKNPDGTWTRIFDKKKLTGTITESGLILNGRSYKRRGR